MSNGKDVSVEEQYPTAMHVIDEEQDFGSLVIFAVFDDSLNAFGDPFFMQNSMVALRAFDDMAQSGEHKFGKWPESYTLYRLGKMDLASGQITPEVPARIQNAAESQRGE